MSDDVICQPLDTLTVAICPVGQRKIIGTGFVVSSDRGLILTCAHVIKEMYKVIRVGLKVGIIFTNPTVEQKHQVATVVGCIPDYDDDVALLQLDNGGISLEQEVFELGVASSSYKRAFSSYGYGCTGQDEYLSAPIEGIVLGPVESQLKLHKKRIYLNTQGPILKGHSGSPVLDQKLNRIVGIIIDSYQSIAGHATDCSILTLENFSLFNLPFSDTPVPKTKARIPRTGLIDNFREDFSVIDLRTFGVPDPTYEEMEWVGRDELLKFLTEEWKHQTKRITTLIGFGGEGKSSLVRRWISTAFGINIFWWSFYKNSDVDAFFEAAINYISDGKYPNPKKETRAEKLGAFLYTGKYLFVLDGFEVMQYSDNLSRYGEVMHNDLHQFLEYFAAPTHDSHCYITSRVPLRFGHYTSVSKHDVDCLSIGDGCKLLRNLGVIGSTEKLEEVVQAWDGHALTLCLVGSYLRERHSGEVTADITGHIEDIHDNERRKNQVIRMLERYDTYLLNKTDKEFLLIFCAFRRPVDITAIQNTSHQLFIHTQDVDDISQSSLSNTVGRLIGFHILRIDRNSQEYTIHPLIRDHYLLQLKKDPEKYRNIHVMIKDYYLKLTPAIFDDFSINILSPLIDSIYHACLAGEYDIAYNIYTQPIFFQSPDHSSQRGYEISDVLMNRLGAYEVTQELLRYFFPQNNALNEPLLQGAASRDDELTELLLQDTAGRNTIFNHLGQCYMYLGDLDKATKCYKRAINGYEKDGNSQQAVTVYLFLAKLYVQMGLLGDATIAAEKALHLAETNENVQDIMAHMIQSSSVVESTQNNISSAQEIPINTIASASILGYIDSIRGDIDIYFAYMIDLCQKSEIPRSPGLLYATHLARSNQINEADRFAQLYLKQQPYYSEVSQCYRIRASAAAVCSDQEVAERHFDDAVKNARACSRRDVLIEALITRGKWLAQASRTREAYEDLGEALEYSQGTYRLHEADIRVALAWTHYATGDLQATRKEAIAAQDISKQFGYAWAHQDAMEILSLVTNE